MKHEDKIRTTLDELALEAARKKNDGAIDNLVFRIVNRYNGPEPRQELVKYYFTAKTGYRTENMQS